MHPWKTNEKFLVVAPRHIKTGTNEEIKTATQISYCISLIICHTTSFLCHTTSSSTNSLNFYINSWSNLTPHNISTVTMPQMMFLPVYKILPPIFILTCDYALILNPFTYLEKFFSKGWRETRYFIHPFHILYEFKMDLYIELFFLCLKGRIYWRVALV